MVMVTFCEALEPMLTLPNAQFDGVAVSVEVDAVPVPLSAIAVGEFVALLAIDKLPLALPAVCGANCAVMLLLWPAAMVSGAVNPVTLNPVPVALA